MSAEDIRSAIDAARVVAPSTVAVDAAKVATVQAAAAQDSAKGRLDAAKQTSAAALEAYESFRDDPTSVAALVRAAEQRRDSARATASLFNDGNIYGGYSHNTRVYWASTLGARANAEQLYIDSMQSALAVYGTQLADLEAAYNSAQGSAEAYAQALKDAQAALVTAQNSQNAVLAGYAEQVAQFVQDAAGSVSKLTDLRGEVMGFYEAQAQAVQAMVQSASNLRGVVDQLRQGQLTTAQTAAELGGRYASSYSMALSTTGSVRAGYVDAMASNLAGLTEALKAESTTSEDWRIQTAKLFAQASNAAGLLEGDAASDDYEDVALELLDSIDAALAELSGATKSAEQIIADAINNGTQAQLEGLRAIVAALKGEAVPAFAAGGFHVGGLRIVGENGPELEATGPSRIWNAQQLSSALGGGGSAEVVAELRALRAENAQLRQESQAHALAMLDQNERVERLLERWDREGQPEQRPEMAVQA